MTGQKRRKPKTRMDSIAAQSSLAQLSAKIAGDDVHQLLRDAQHSATARLVRELRGDPNLLLAKQAEEAERNAALIRGVPSPVAALSGTSLEMLRILNSPTGIERFFFGNTNRYTDLRGLQNGFLPSAGVITSASGHLAQLVAPYATGVSSLSAWEETLAARMLTLKTPWTLPDLLDESMFGFARLSRLSDAVHTDEPFSEHVSELVSEELGTSDERNLEDVPLDRDAAAVDAGLHAELIAFPPGAYRDVTIAAGFKFRLSGTSAPEAIEAADPGAVIDPHHWLVLVKVEQQLRQLVARELQTLAGRNWIKQRVPPLVCIRWTERQDEDRAAGRPVYPPIQYADFMDLVDVICRSDNWGDAFKPIFRNPDDFRVSLQRLHPVRKAIAHSRPIGRADYLTLISEVTRILRALGVEFLI